MEPSGTSPSASVLVVDDNLKNLQVIGSLLREEGYRLFLARSGEEALKTASEVRPDVILLDAMMPGIDGFETCRRLKDNDQTSDISVLFLTALSEEEHVVRAFESGALDYLTKPFNSRELLARVETHTALRQTQAERDRHLSDLESAFAHIERIQREQEAFLRHELNNAIGPILGYADMLLGHLSVDPERQRKWLSKIREGATAMHRLLTSMKELQELERGRANLELEELDLAALVKEECARIGDSHLPAFPVMFQSETRKAPIRGEASLLPGVFSNLLKNAVEHVLDLSSEKDRAVSVTLRKDNGHFRVAIANGGPPIPANQLGTFFDKFNSTKVGGTGLGTSYARIITEAHGGTIDVESSSKAGTTVTLRFPAAD